MGKRRNPKSASTSSEEGEDRDRGAESGDEEGELDTDEEGERRRGSERINY